MSNQLFKALVIYKKTINNLPKTFPPQTDSNGFRLDHIEAMKEVIKSIKEPTP